LKEECVWVDRFAGFAQARRAIAAWIAWYTEERPHQALGYRSPEAFRARSLRA
jgi:putative transposase